MTPTPELDWSSLLACPSCGGGLRRGDEAWSCTPCDRRYPVVAGCLPGAGGGRSLAINGHVDVVPVGDTSAWSHDPWAGEIADGKIWGRGTTDMKGGVAAGMIAARALREAGVPLAGDLWLHVVADEEVVGFSTRRLIEKLPNVDAVIDAEPTDLKIMPTEGGLVHFRMEFDGRESHAGGGSDRQLHNRSAPRDRRPCRPRRSE